MTDGCLNLSSDVAMHRARQFLREMAQPAPDSANVSLDAEQLRRHANYVSFESRSHVGMQAHPMQTVGVEPQPTGAEPPVEEEPMDIAV
eukprot:6189827-Pleurochrysis_carterae.AAC.3